MATHFSGIKGGRCNTSRYQEPAPNILFITQRMVQLGETTSGTTAILRSFYRLIRQAFRWVRVPRNMKYGMRDITPSRGRIKDIRWYILIWGITISTTNMAHGKNYLFNLETRYRTASSQYNFLAGRNTIPTTRKMIRCSQSAQENDL